MKTPDLGEEELAAQKAFKMTLLNVNKSASLGIWLIAIPLYFILCLSMKSFFQVNLHFHEVLVPMIASLNKGIYLSILCFVLFVLCPLASIFINALAIVHVSYDGERKEIVLTVKLKWKSLLMILLSGAVFSLAAAFYLKFLIGVLILKN